MKQILPVLADVANGIFATVIAGLLFSIDIAPWHMLIGIAFAMLPDIDAIPELVRRGKLAASSDHNHDHRELLHYPIFFILISGAVAFVDPFFGVLLFIATMLHFINDLYGTGWGVPVFWPITRDRFKLFADQENNFSFKLSDVVRRIRFMTLHQKISEHGDEYWIDSVYLKFNAITVIEYCLFVFSLILAAFVLLY